MRLVLWISAVAAGSVAAYLMIGYVVAARLSASVRQPVGRTPADVGLDYREVALRSSDGLSLSAWWVDKAGSSRAAVLVHGWTGDKSNLHVVETALVYERAGFNVLMLDLRGHGRSEGERGTLGYKEVRDVRGALSWLEERGFDPEDVEPARVPAPATDKHRRPLGAIPRDLPGPQIEPVAAPEADLPVAQA